MDLQLWLYYLIAILILTASPGPSVLLCVTKSATQGFNYAVYSAFGSLNVLLELWLYHSLDWEQYCFFWACFYYY